MVVGGLSRERPDYVEDMANMAIEMLDFVAQHPLLVKRQLGIHIGIATGPVVAGVIGTKRFSYDLWGDTVNIASRLTDEAAQGEIVVEKNTYNRLRQRYLFAPPANIVVKGKGELTAYRLTGKITANRYKDNSSARPAVANPVPSDAPEAARAQPAA